MYSCSKELNQWEPLTEYGQSKGHSNPYLVLECAWRVSNWAAMKEALVQVRNAQSPHKNVCIYGFLHMQTHIHTHVRSHCLPEGAVTPNGLTENRNYDHKFSLTQSQTYWSL